MAVTAPAVLAEQPRLCFEDLYAAHQPRVYRTCLAILRNSEDAAEATQEVFSRALPLLTQLREPHVWLQTVARNYCFDQLRRQKLRGHGVLDEDTPGPLRDDPERETMLRDALRQAFDALSPRERRALARVLLMDDSLADIASMLGVSYGAAAQVVSRARRRAALAARAVIGASLAWLGRLTFPRDRERATRVATQVLESGQHIVLAAAVVLTAGSMARGAQAMGPATDSGAGAIPAAPAAAVHVERSAAAPPALVSVQAVAPPAASLPTLPSGYLPGPISVGPGQGRPAHSIDNPTPTPPPAPVVLSVHPPMSAGTPCTSAGVATGPGSLPVSQSVEVCKP